MNIMELGAIGELVVGVAVLATLLYLAIQIRHSAESSFASTQSGIHAEFNRFHEMGIASPELLAAIELAATGEELDPLQRRQFHHFAFRLVNQWLSVQVAYDHGSVDDEYFAFIKEDVAVSCRRWPGLEDEVRAISADYSIRPEVLERFYQEDRR